MIRFTNKLLQNVTPVPGTNRLHSNAHFNDILLLKFLLHGYKNVMRKPSLPLTLEYFVSRGVLNPEHLPLTVKYTRIIGMMILRLFSARYIAGYRIRKSLSKLSYKTKITQCVT